MKAIAEWIGYLSVLAGAGMAMVIAVMIALSPIWLFGMIVIYYLGCS